MAKTTDTIYVKHSDGATHQISGRRAAKFRKECLAGRGNVEITAMILAGYTGFLSDEGIVEDFEALPAYYASHA